jgi:hypothetical protein
MPLATKPCGEPIIQILKVLVVRDTPILAVLLEMVQVSVGPAEDRLDSIMQ